MSGEVDVPEGDRRSLMRMYALIERIEASKAEAVNAVLDCVQIKLSEVAEGLSLDADNYVFNRELFRFEKKEEASGRSNEES